jgi:U3 small nucleolar RNA-associated protein 7
MATSGVDRSMKIWDIRNLDGPVQDYRLRTAAVDLEFSQKDMLAVGLGETVEVYELVIYYKLFNTYFIQYLMGFT